MPKGWRLAIQLIGFAIGVSLIVWLARSAFETNGWEELSNRATPGTLAGLIICSLASILINGMNFWIVVRPVRREGFWAIQSVNATASMLNFAPIRLGLVSRYLYHMRVDRMSFLFVTGWIFAIVISLMIVMGSASLATVLYPSIDIWWLLIASVPIILTIMFLPPLMRLPAIRKKTRGSERMLSDRTALRGSLLLRFLDLLTWAGRLWFASLLLDTGLSTGDVLLLSIFAVVMSLNPLGRIGFREVAIAWIAPMLAESTLTGDELDAQFAQLALIESGAEAMVVIPVGLIAGIWWILRVRKGSPANPHLSSEPSAS